MSDVRVVLVNYRSWADVERRVRSDALTGQDVIVVDNDSDPSKVEELCADVGAHSLLLPHNAGFAAAVNAAVRTTPAADLPWLLLNPDVQLTTEALRSLLAALRPGIDGVAPLLREPSGRLQVGAGGGPLTARSVASYFLFGSHVLNTTGIFYTRRQSRRRSYATWLCMACLLIQPDAFARFGPLPEDELVYAEDVGWGTAAADRGARWRLLNDVVVDHAKGASGGSDAWIGAVERLCRRRLSHVGAWIAVASIRLGLGIRRALGRRIV